MSSGTPANSIRHHPLTWLVAGAIVIGGASALIIAPAGMRGAVGAVVPPIIGAVVALLLYRIVMHRMAQRSTPELARRGALFEALLGIEVGLVFIAVSVAMITVLGGYRIEWAASDVLPVVLPIVAGNVGAAVVEEVIFRGLVLQALEQLGGGWMALAGMSLLFGLLHLGNLGATVWSALAIAIEAGVLLGAAFLWRRTLWCAIGMHFAWNTAVGLLGIPVSGHASIGLFTTTATGSTLLTGGDFGLEASLVTVVVSLLFSIPMLMLAHRRGNLVSRSRALHRGAASSAAGS